MKLWDEAFAGSSNADQRLEFLQEHESRERAFCGDGAVSAHGCRIPLTVLLWGL